MNLRDLEYLVAIDDERHFGKAAERCFVSQPTLSGQLKKFEEHLGVQLVERSNRKVMLTEVGSEIAERARSVLAAVGRIEELARTHTDPMSGKINMGLIPTVAPYLLPHMVGPIKEEWPELELLLHEDQTAVLVRMLREGRLDLLVLALGIPGTEGFEELPLYDEPFYLAVPAKHAYAGRTEVTTDDLKGQKILLLEDGHCLRGQALDVCFSAGAREADHFRATSLETLRHMVAAGAGITLVPELAVPPPREASPLVRYIRFREPAPSRQIGLLFRKNSSRRPCFEQLALDIRDAYRGPEEETRG